MDEISVFHVLCQALQKAERLVENHRHCYLGELLKKTLKGKEGPGFIKKKKKKVIHDGVEKAVGNIGLQISSKVLFHKSLPMNTCNCRVFSTVKSHVQI